MIRREDSPRSDFTLIYNNSTISAIVVYIIDTKNCLIWLYLYNQAKQLSLLCPLSFVLYFVLSLLQQLFYSPHLERS